jgi:hypothetical protein
VAIDLTLRREAAETAATEVAETEATELDKGRW